MERRRVPVHRTILVVDVQGFGDRRRTNPHQLAVRDGLYQALKQAFRAAAIPWEGCQPEDRGDGVLFLAPADVPKSGFAEVLPEALAEALRAHHDGHRAEEQFRLRMALHAGEVSYDDHGVTGTAINLAFRLVDAGPLKDALAGSPGVLALIASPWFYHEVIRNSPDARPETYRPVQVAVKETTEVGWICLPDHPYPPDEPQVAAPHLLAPVPPLSAAARHGDSRRVSGLPVLAPVAHLPEIRGRDELLAGLQRLLRTSPGTLVVLAGPGGVGKSAVAASLIQRAQGQGAYRRLPRTWWVSAADRASLTGGLVTVAGQIGASSADIEAIEGDACDAPDRLWTLLERVRRSWLLVLDNADDPSVLGRAAPTAYAAGTQQPASAASPADGTGWLRRTAHGLVVVTSRDGLSSAWGRHARIVRIDPLEEGDGARVLLDRAPGAGTDSEARDLARRLGGLPLALQLAGSYLRSEAALLGSFSEYLLALDDLSSRHRLLTSRPDLDAPAGERQILMRTWELSLDTLSRKGIPQARPLLRVLSCYAPARPIPLWLLTPTGLGRLLTGAKAARRLPAPEAGQRFEDGLHALLRMSLIDIRPFDGTGPRGRAVVVHPMIADANRTHLRDDLGHKDRRAEAALACRIATELVTDAVGRLDFDRITDWPRYLVLGPHLHALLTATAPQLDRRRLRGLVDAAVLTARAHNFSGAIPAGENLLRTAVSAAGRIGQDDPASLRAWHELGWPLVILGRAREAEAIYRDVLARRIRVLGDSHPDTLASRHELAWVAASQGRWVEAETGYRDVLAARQRVHGAEHPGTLVTQHELAWAIANQGRYQEAEQLLADILGASRTHRGEDHPRTLMIRHELAWAAANQGRWDQAVPAYRELLAARRRIFGDDHPDVLTTGHELAWALSGQGQRAAAVRQYSEVLAARRRVLGDGHPDTLVTAQALELLRQGQVASPRHLA